MKKVLIYPALLILILLVSCGKKDPGPKPGILSEKQMVELLVDTHITDAILFVENSRSDDKRDKALYYYPSVLEKLGITKAQMDASVVWYMKHPEAYARIYDQVIEKLKKIQDAGHPQPQANPKPQ